MKLIFRYSLRSINDDDHNNCVHPPKDIKNFHNNYNVILGSLSKINKVNPDNLKMMFVASVDVE